MKFPRRPWLRVALVFGLLLAAAGGYYVLRYQAWAAYRNWSFRRMNNLARDFIAADDPRNALLTLRRVLRSRPNDVEAWRLGVAAARKRDTGEVVHYQRNLRRVEPTPENQLELIRVALRYHANAVALQAVIGASAEVSARADYHRLAAEVYRLAGRDTAARYHLVSLLGLEPGDVAAQLALAEVEFDADGVAVAPDWAGRVAHLATGGVTAVPATLLQLRLATLQRDTAAARPVVVRLRERTDLTVAQRLQLLEGIELSDPAGAAPFLAATQHQAALAPTDTRLVMTWLGRQERTAEITRWYAGLPETVRKDQGVKLLAARALDAGRDWPALEQLVSGARWPAEEAQRLALLAHATRMLGRSTESAEAWKLAVIAIGQDARAGARLLQAVSAWDWQEERRDVLWRLFALVPANRAVRDELIAHEFLGGNTVNLNKIFARIVEAAPDDDEARNNFAYTSLLLGTNLGRASAIARELRKKNPDKVAYLTTYTLALHKAGQSAQALELLAKLGPLERESPSVILHEATYAGATGNSVRAAELIGQLQRVRMLPEEVQLVADTRTVVAQASARAGRGQVLAAASATTTTGGWLAWLPETAREAPEDLRLADAYYREENFAALAELVRAGKWREHEYLRHALGAYGRRRQSGAESGRDEWRQALAMAGRDSRKLRDLQELATRWQWPAERMEVSARRFEREAADPKLMVELLDFYRQQSRTADLARTLWLYVNETKTTGAEAAWCVYYSLLCDLNVDSAQTLAHRVFTASPQAKPARIAYAFALWRQRRPAEAWVLLQDLEPADAAGMKVALIQAAVLLELGRKLEAQSSLGRFSSAGAMPEEKTFAETLSRRAGLLGTALTLNPPGIK